MTDKKNIITLGIGASPGSLLWFITGGLEGSTEFSGTPKSLTAPSRDFQLTANRRTRFGGYAVTIIRERGLSDGDTRVLSDGDTRIVQDKTITFLLTAQGRDFSLTPDEREYELTAKSRDYTLTA